VHWQNSDDFNSCWHCQSNEVQVPWSSVLRELHVGGREHDLQELWIHLHTLSVAKKEKDLRCWGLNAYEPFSDFHDKKWVYAGAIYPSDGIINTVYIGLYGTYTTFFGSMCISIDRPCHQMGSSFKLQISHETVWRSYICIILFTLLNEFEQIRFQAFVPTKSLSHVRRCLGRDGQIIRQAWLNSTYSWLHWQCC